MNRKLYLTGRAKAVLIAAAVALGLFGLLAGPSARRVAGAGIFQAQRIAYRATHWGERPLDYATAREWDRRLRELEKRLNDATAERAGRAEGRRPAEGGGAEARVIGRDPDLWLKRVKIDLGESHGVAPGAYALSDGGLVGRVTETGAAYSSVALISDPEIGVAVRLEPSGEEGVAFGDGGAALRVRFIDPLSAVKAGERVETSGLDGAYPDGILVGETVEARKDPRERDLTVRVRPAADLRRLYRVRVYSKK